MILCLPLGKWHAIKRFAAFVLGHVDPALIRGLLIPALQAVSAKTGLVHHVNVLHVGAVFHQVFLQTTKGSSFEFDLFLCVHFIFL